MPSSEQFLGVSNELWEKIALSAIILGVLVLLRLGLNLLIRRRMSNVQRIYRWRRAVLYVFTTLVVLTIAPIWIRGFGSLTSFLGLVSAGVAVAMHDTIANVTGWFFILSLRPFKVGDRIQIGETKGDVIDIGVFQFSMVEVGNWVDADQSTGRIVHVPNSKVLKEPLMNYQIGFEYVWHEIPVLVTFESNWRKAKELLNRIAHENTEQFSEGVEAQIRRAAEKYLIHYGSFTPIVYTTVKESGVQLTVRHLVNPRQRRGAEQLIWEATLDAFATEPDIDLAYPTTRFYSAPGPARSVELEEGGLEQRVAGEETGPT